MSMKDLNGWNQTDKLSRKRDMSFIAILVLLGIGLTAVLSVFVESSCSTLKKDGSILIDCAGAEIKQDVLTVIPTMIAILVNNPGNALKQLGGLIWAFGSDTIACAAKEIANPTLSVGAAFDPKAAEAALKLIEWEGWKYKP